MKKKLFYCFLGGLLLSACGKPEPEMDVNLETSEKAYSHNANYSAYDQPQKKSTLTENLKLIKNGEIQFQVKDLEVTSAKIRKLAADLNGYISKDYSADNGRSAYTTLEIRLPNENFDAFMSYAEKSASGEVKRKVDVKDVTKEYVDFELRLNAAKKAQERYLELLKKANKVEDMLAVEQKLQEVLVEIESIEGQIRYYQDKIALSTITVEMRTVDEVVVEREEGFWFDMKNAVKRGWNLILGFIVAITHLWVFIPLVALGIWWYRKRKS